MLGHRATKWRTLAKEAAADLDIAVSYNKIPKSVVKRELESTSVDKWQRDWNQTTKGSTTKDYFPKEEETVNQPEPHHYDDGSW